MCFSESSQDATEYHDEQGDKQDDNDYLAHELANSAQLRRGTVSSNHPLRSQTARMCCASRALAFISKAVSAKLLTNN